MNGQMKEVVDESGKARVKLERACQTCGTVFSQELRGPHQGCYFRYCTAKCTNRAKLDQNAASLRKARGRERDQLFEGLPFTQEEQCQ